MTLPKVSCFCSTYGRPWVVEEVIECFLKQDYKGEKELVILNDYANQQLEYTHPEIHIFNISKRIEPLGRKFNINVGLCSGDVIFVWEDDDIYLPHRLSYTIEKMGDAEFFHTNKGFFEEAPFKLISSENVFHANLALTKKLFRELGGYSEIDKCSVDLSIIQKLADKFGNISSKILEEDIFYIYRWGSINSYHASGWSGDVSPLSAQVVAQQREKGVVKDGVIKLEKNWKYNYLEYLPKTITTTPVVTIIKATYGGIDVSEKVKDLIKMGTTTFKVSNDIFGDLLPGKLKAFECEYEYNGCTQLACVEEGFILKF